MVQETEHSPQQSITEAPNMSKLDKPVHEIFPAPLLPSEVAPPGVAVKHKHTEILNLKFVSRIAHCLITRKRNST